MYAEKIKTAFDKYSKHPLPELKTFQVLSQQHPKGERVFWMEKRFEFLEQIKDKTIIGNRWINSGCPSLLNFSESANILNETANDIYMLYSRIGDGNKKYIPNYSEIKESIISENIESVNKEIDTFFMLYFKYAFVNCKISKLNDRRFMIENVQIIRNLFYLVKDAFKCDETTFIQTVEAANFVPSDLKTKITAYYTIYALSKIMGESWYDEVVLNMGVTKSQLTKNNRNVPYRIKTKIEELIPDLKQNLKEEK